MICPKWLVQSSAVGVVAVAVVAVPLWIASPPSEEEGGEEVVRIRIVVPGPEGAEEARSWKEKEKQKLKARARAEEVRERNRRAREVRTHLYELTEGPHCPVEVRREAEKEIWKSLEEARTGVEKR